MAVYCVVVGNMYDGFQAVGPFPDQETASQWADGAGNHGIPEYKGFDLELVTPEEYNPGPDLT